MSMWETPETPAGPAGGDDIALTTPTNADVPGLGAAVGDICPTCGGSPGLGSIGRCQGCIEEEWARACYALFCHRSDERARSDA